ncbi:hypothetical protein SBA3_3140001 [Candidatus Sulfopaludibacter sp. SbA3]|nr:hypothetical protein SBA3_3140001 [Candidatus Sulfopaludibacter sp. SbA3]
MVFFSYGFLGTRGAPVHQPDGRWARTPGVGDRIRNAAAECNAANVSIYAFESAPTPAFRPAIIMTRRRGPKTIMAAIRTLSTT